jgi:4-amino-4-deoxy-L-arabinose transferase-like glycosyltransferase
MPNTDQPAFPSPAERLVPGGNGPAARVVQRLLPALALLIAFLVPVLMVPPTPQVPLIDDWIYQPSVEHLLQRHELWIAPPTAVTLVAQVFWGALFALPFGVSPVALRCSTLLAGFGGVLACFGLYRELRATRSRAIFGALAVGFTPLTFILSRTFMSDVPYLALVSVTGYVLVRAAHRSSVRAWAVGSALAGLAFLVRQQGVLLPAAAFVWLLAARPPWFRARPWRTMLATFGPCLVAVAGYAVWIASTNLPAKQQEFVHTIRDAGWSAALDLTWRLAMVGLFYVGLFVFPLVLGAVPALPVAWHRAGSGGRVFAIGALVTATLWTNGFALAHQGRSFPFIPYGSVIHEDGLGTLDDVAGWRPALLSSWMWAALGLLCAACASAAVLLVVARAQQRSGEDATVHDAALVPSAAGLVVALGLGQFAGMLPPTLPIAHLIAYDRYYLPLLPFAVGLVLWALRGQRFSLPVALLALVLLAAVDIVGVQDWLAFKEGVWQTAAWLVQEQGVPLRQVEGGLEWDGVHFYEDSLTDPEDRAPRRNGDPWWLDLFAPPIDPIYQVAAMPQARPGYHLAARRPYHSWIRTADEAWIYVWKRDE